MRLYFALLKTSSRFSVTMLRTKNMSLEDALHDLIVKGYRYQQLETMYGKHVSDREVWSRSSTS